MEFEGRFIDIMEVFNVDKYEFNIKLEQIKKLAAKKEYKQAAEIAKQMNWNKVKDWSTLATIINVQEAAGDYEEARDMAILAYNRNLGGRKLYISSQNSLSKLTILKMLKNYTRNTPNYQHTMLISISYITT